MRKIIAIDFDGCLCSNAFPEIGTPHWEIITRAAQERADGAALILWTCRVGQRLQEALEACARWGLQFDAVNDNLPEMVQHFGGSNCRKVVASEYWDDHAVLAGGVQAACPLCHGKRLASVGMDEHGVYLAGGLSTPPEDERLAYCPKCGRPLKGGRHG